MSDYDYLNARIKGLSAQLLPPAFFQQMVSLADEQGLVDVLLESPYGPVLRDRLHDVLSLPLIEQALRAEWARTVERVWSWAPEGPRSLLEIQVRWPDLRNVLTLLRAKVAQADRQDVLAAWVPGGTLTDAHVAALLDEPDVLQMVDTLSVWGFPLAGALKSMGAALRQREAMIEAENRLAQAYFDWAWQRCRGLDDNRVLIREFLRQQIDLANVLLSLRTLRHREHGVSVALMDPLEHGTLGPVVLRRLRDCPDLDSALETLAGTYFQTGVERGILAFGEHRRLGVMERFLEQVVLVRGCRLFRCDPLGIGVAAGYLWRKLNEFLNLRILLRGKAYRLPAAAIREELLLV